MALKDKYTCQKRVALWWNKKNNPYLPVPFGHDPGRSFQHNGPNQTFEFNVSSASIGCTHDASSILLVKTGIMLTYGYAASNDSNTLTWDEAMAKVEHREQWLEATQVKIMALAFKQAWDEVAAETSM
jgi:hypothetical protein